MTDDDLKLLLTDTNLKMLFGGVQCVSFALVVFLTGRLFLKTKRYGRTILFGWLWIFLWAVANCLIFPLAFEYVGFRGAFYFFPDMPLILAMAVMGWMYGVLFAAAIFLVRLGTTGFRTWRERSLAQSEIEP